MPVDTLGSRRHHRPDAEMPGDPSLGLVGSTLSIESDAIALPRYAGCGAQGCSQGWLGEFLLVMVLLVVR